MFDHNRRKQIKHVRSSNLFSPFVELTAGVDVDDTALVTEDVVVSEKSIMNYVYIHF